MKAFLAKFTPHGLAAGFVAACLLGFGPGLVTFTASAEHAADEQSRAAVLAALTPVCVARAVADPQYTVRVAELSEASSYKQPGLLSDYGWATMPGEDSADRALANACAEGVLDAYEAETG